MTTISSDAASLTAQLAELVRVVQFRDRDRACCYGISVSQCYALEAVVEGSDATVNDVAAALYLDKSTASRVCKGLVDRGLVARTRDPADGRTVRLQATPEGAALHRSIRAELVQEYGELMADFPAEVRSGAVELIGRLATAFGARVDASGGTCCVIKTPVEPVRQTQEHG